MSTPPPDTDNPLSKILEAALDIKSLDAQEKYIREACAGDEGLLKEVKDLLPFARIEKDLERLAEDENSLIGKTIGKYKIRKEIGHGGMGMVYLGVRTKDFNHLAAIKVIRQGGFTKEDIRRFGKEMKIVASLDHPNIARLIDGGVTKTKLPYFVMDYVAGWCVNDYCDKNNLSIRERIELFRKICTVIEYLHSKGVIHRDIKPSNIMINADGEPKIIDFGIAHVINSAAMLGTNDLTSLLQRAFSRDYASPEQVRGDRVIERATDVYSLGAVLYELIAGHKPHRFTSSELSNITKVICQDEPIKPSKVISVEEFIHTANHSERIKISLESVSAARDCTPKQLQRALSGDLDCITMKALRKEPRRRYTSVQDIIADLDNYLLGRTISARKGSRGYHLGRGADKFFGKLPPYHMNWPKKAAIYICLAALCLAAWQFPRLKRWTLIGYTMVTSDRVNAPTLSLSNSGRGKVKTATRMLIDHLGPEVNSPQHSPNAWTMAQMAISLEGQSQVNKEHVQRFLSDLMSPDCNCWHEGSQSPKDLRVSTWVLIGMSRLGLSASDEQLDFLLNTMQPDGWWTIYTEHPNKGGMPINQKYASTYATALSLLALSLQSQLKNADPIKKEKVKDAIKRGRNWLLKTRLIGRARWSDYPFNDDKSETLGVTGLVLHVLHSTSENANELNEIDQLWLDDLPGLKMDAKGRETSSVVIDTFNLRDPSSQFPLQWSIVATVDAYPSGTSLQKAKAIVWLDNIAENFEDLAKGVIGETDWIAAELLIALRYLQGEKVI